MTIRVNGQIIPEEAVQFELDRLVKFYSEQIPSSEVVAQMDALRQRAQEQAIGAKLLMDEAQRLDFQVTDEDVQGRLTQIKKQLGGDSKFVELMRRQNLSEELVCESIRRGLRVDMLVERCSQGVAEPTEADLRAHFDSHAGEYTQPDRVHAQHILIAVPSNKSEDHAVARSRIMEVKRQIAEGAEFSDLAAAYSDCPSGRKAGGSLGWVDRGTTVPELDSVLFSMEPGEVSDVVRTSLGYHVVRKIAEQAGGPSEFDDVREKIREFLRHVARGQAISAYVAELKAKAVIETDEE